MIRQYIKRSSFLQRHFSDHKLVTRYILVGSIGAFVNIAVLYILTNVVGVWYITSSIFSFTASLIVAFILQKCWAFKDLLFVKKYLARQAILYTISSVSFLILNILILYALVEMFNTWYILAQFFSLGSVAVGSFMFNKAFTFKASVITVPNI